MISLVMAPPMAEESTERPATELAIGVPAKVAWPLSAEFLMPVVPIVAPAMASAVVAVATRFARAVVVRPAIRMTTRVAAMIGELQRLCSLDRVGAAIRGTRPGDGGEGGW